MRLAWVLLLLPCSLGAIEGLDERPMELSAMQVDYKNRTMLLTGDVVVEHDFGKMSAQYAEIRSLPHEKKLRLGSIHLKDKVNVILKGEGQLSCGVADIDYLQMIGSFKENVLYVEAVHGKKSAPPLLVKSNQMTLKINPPAAQGSSTKNFVEQILVEGDVSVNYNSNLTANGDKGLYERRSTSSCEGLSTGVITLEMLTEDGLCNVVNQSGDEINASRIRIDTLTKKLSFDKASGLICGSREESNIDQKIAFSADRLLWDSALGQMSLQGDVTINQAGQGVLTSDGEVRLFQRSLAGKKRLCLLETEGKTVLVFKEPGKPAEHTLTSYGPVSIDHVRLLTTMESPSCKGKVADENQLFLKDELGEIHANKAFLYYTAINGKITLSKVRLEGNVRLKDCQQPSGDVLHYVIADVVEFLPEFKEMIFTARAKRRVLFYDKVNSVQVSAPAIKIKRDEMTKKESIKGIGDVRFSFLEQEYAQLRKRFKLDATEALLP